MQAALPLCSANYSQRQLNSRKHRQVLEHAVLLDGCVEQYSLRGQAYWDVTYQTRVYSEIHMEAPVPQLNGPAMMPAFFFEVHEWDPFNAQHRQLVRNCLVAHLRLTQMRDKVGNKFVHPLCNVYLLNQDGTIACGGNKKALPVRGVTASTTTARGMKESKVLNAEEEEASGAHIKGHVRMITVMEVPRHDLSLLDLIDKTGPLPEAILGCILSQLVLIIERLHVQCGCLFFPFFFGVP